MQHVQETQTFATDYGEKLSEVLEKRPDTYILHMNRMI